MQFKKCAVVGVLITLYLSTDSWCHYIPAGTKLADRKTSDPKTIRECGRALTDFILKACNGTVNPLSQANYGKEGVQKELTELCCHQICPLPYIQSYCAEDPVSTSKNTSEENLPNDLMPSQLSGSVAKQSSRPKGNNKNEGISEVRVRERKYGKRKWGRSKKRKQSFKRKCAYKSFGRYLLKLERGNGVHDNMAKKHRQRLFKHHRYNTITSTYPPIEIGTISPEKFGGEPIVEVKRTKSNSI